MKVKFIKFFFVFIILIILIYNPISARLFTLFAAAFYDLDPSIFYHQIKSESSFRSLAFSSKGAIGLGQVKPETSRYIAPEFKTIWLWFPLSNLFISAKYTKYLLKK